MGSYVVDPSLYDPAKLEEVSQRCGVQVPMMQAMRDLFSDNASSIPRRSSFANPLERATSVQLASGTTPTNYQPSVALRANVPRTTSVPDVYWNQSSPSLPSTSAARPYFSPVPQFPQEPLPAPSECTPSMLPTGLRDATARLDSFFADLDEPKESPQGTRNSLPPLQRQPSRNFNLSSSTAGPSNVPYYPAQDSQQPPVGSLDYGPYWFEKPQHTHNMSYVPENRMSRIEIPDDWRFQVGLQRQTRRGENNETLGLHTSMNSPTMNGGERAVQHQTSMAYPVPIPEQNVAQASSLPVAPSSRPVRSNKRVKKAKAVPVPSAPAGEPIATSSRIEATPSGSAVPTPGTSVSTPSQATPGADSPYDNPHVTVLIPFDCFTHVPATSSSGLPMFPSPFPAPRPSSADPEDSKPIILPQPKRQKRPRSTDELGLFLAFVDKVTDAYEKLSGLDHVACPWPVAHSLSCGKSIGATRNSVWKHLKEDHGLTDSVQPTCQLPNGDGTGQCAATMTGDSLGRHILSVHLKHGRNCPICMTDFSRDDSVTRHCQTKRCYESNVNATRVAMLRYMQWEEERTGSIPRSYVEGLFDPELK
ncbi:hypothetical protein JAAARDRAFT_195850 [Jaapia argillacea MUCL 33604]|uniref:Uncharacterized protein n=1 Tax=Jaapia argillacea MUCL 33604 TaxID=933084 RepID=A0A067PNT9_9AGAM|nr:hypothetical protein JAAARDRAFT_195850 [Jaapia argillacea MUCL 33604]